MTVDSVNLNVHGVSGGQANLMADWGNQIAGTGNYQICGGQSCPVYPQTAQATVTVIPPNATITVHFGPGSKTAGDNLKFLSSSSECSENLGLLNCPTQKFWHWNVEVQIAVSDDAPNWTVTQSWDTGRKKGNWKDSTGALHGFSIDVSAPCPSPCDGPSSSFLQKTAGQKNIFYIDGPGHGYLLQTAEPIDSMTQVQNFTAKVCSTLSTSTCFSQQWFFKLVVKPGAILDTTNSTAALGTAPLP